MSEIRVDTISEKTSANGVAIDGVTIKDGGITATTGSIVFNEDSADVDFRVESNGNANMLFVNGGTDRIGVGINDPLQALEVRGQIGISASGTGSKFLGFYSSDTLSSFIEKNGDNLTLYNVDAGEIRLATNDAEQVRIHSNGVVSATAGVALGVGTANTASNVLDDYEEGTFTPDFDDSSNNSPTSMYQAQGFYTKVGRAVTIQVYVEVNVKGGGMNGNVMRISNLPFAPISSGLGFNSMAVSYISNLDVNSLPVGAAVYGNNSFIYLYYLSGDNSAQITPSMISNGTRLAIGGTYMSS